MRWKATALCLIACVIATSVQSAEITKQQVDDAIAASMIRINGKQYPDQVPYHVRMSMFFERLRTGDTAARLASVLSSADLAVLTGYAAQHAQAQATEVAAHKQAWLAVADHAESMNAGELAGAMKRVSSESENRQAARYRAVLAKLSPEGQTTVTNFAFETIRPQVVSSDETLLAAALPDYYKAQIIGGREAFRTGKFPGQIDPRGKARSTESSSDSKLVTP